jgi:hypothetical protein
MIFFWIGKKITKGKPQHRDYANDGAPLIKKIKNY